MDLSVMVITFNEEKRLGRLLKSLPENVELVVVDSQSTDRTVEIAKAHGAKIESRAFDDFSSQKNKALSLCTKRWILSLDADEELSSELREKICAIASQAKSNYQAYHLKRRLIFQGKTLCFGKSTDKPLRLFQNGQGKFINPIHERLEFTPGTQIGFLSEPIWHYSYDNLAAYFDRFNKYTTLIAQNSFKKRKPLWLVFLQLIFRPGYEFLSRFFFRLGFLDGYQGYLYAMLSSFYTFVKYAKLYEIYQQESPK